MGPCLFTADSLVIPVVILLSLHFQLHLRFTFDRDRKTLVGPLHQAVQAL